MVRKSASCAGQTTLSQLAGLLSCCDLFLTNDTGALHIAAALDVPTVALFGPGDPVKVRPLSARALVFHHPISCSPCQVQYTDKCRDNLCMQMISVDEAKATIEKVLEMELRNISSSAGLRNAPATTL
jgi:ADP-heptose:LPS heptosyltransferase